MSYAFRDYSKNENAYYLALHIIWHVVNKSSRLLADVDGGPSLHHLRVCAYIAIVSCVRNRNTLLEQNAKRRSRKNGGRGWSVTRATKITRRKRKWIRHNAGWRRRIPACAYYCCAHRDGMSEKRMCICMQLRARGYRKRAKNATRILGALYIRMRCNKNMPAFIRTYASYTADPSARPLTGEAKSRE